MNGGLGFQPVELAGRPVGISGEGITEVVPVPRKLTAFGAESFLKPEA
jgi:hypothetical protein